MVTFSMQAMELLLATGSLRAQHPKADKKKTHAE
jgi:hypothetical protein